MRRSSGRTYRGRTKNRKFAIGKRAWAICQRGGHRIRYLDGVIEPGTGLFVDKRWSDGIWNRVDHPQNGTVDATDAIGLENAHPDRVEPAPNYVFFEDGSFLISDDDSDGAVYAPYPSVIDTSGVDP